MTAREKEQVGRTFRPKSKTIAPKVKPVEAPPKPQRKAGWAKASKPVAVQKGRERKRGEK